MSDGWYYADGDKSVGPMALDDLGRALGARSNPGSVLVWRDGFAAWKPAAEVPELASIVGGAPPVPGIDPARGAGGAPAAQYPDANSNSYMNLWFNFSGRLNRGKYWFVTLINLAVLVVLGIVAFASYSTALWVLFGLVSLVLLVSGLAVGAKRLHDRDKSAWWLVLFYLGPSILSGIGSMFGEAIAMLFSLVGAAISIWAFVEIGCLRGTRGPNTYGPDPLPPGD